MEYNKNDMIFLAKSVKELEEDLMILKTGLAMHLNIVNAIEKGSLFYDLDFLHRFENDLHNQYYSIVRKGFFNEK